MLGRTRFPAPLDLPRLVEDAGKAELHGRMCLLAPLALAHPVLSEGV